MNWLRYRLRNWLKLPGEEALTGISGQLMGQVSRLAEHDKRLAEIESYIAATRKRDREEELAEKLALAEQEISRLNHLIPREQPEGPYRAKSWADARNYRG